MDRNVVDRWCERGIIGLALAILVSMPLAFGGRPQLPVGCWLDFWLLDPFLLAQGLMVALLALWLVRVWVTPRPRLLWPPICWVVTAFALCAVGRYATADIEYVARLELLRILVYAFLFLAIVNHLHRQETAQLVALTMLVVATAISFYAAYQFLSGSDRVWQALKPYAHRGSGTFICPNHLGGFLEMLLPLGLTLTLMGRFKPLTKVFLGYASAVMLAGIAFTASRGSWVSTAVGLLFLFAALLTHRTYRLPALVLLLCLLGAGAYFVPRSAFLEKRAKQTFINNVQDDSRFALWRAALRIWEENPWFGAGPAHYDYRFRPYRPEAIQVRPDQAHNDYLNLLADWGLVGFGLVGLAWTLLLVGVVQTWRHVRSVAPDLGSRKQRTSRFALLLGGSCGLVAILAHSMVDFNMYIPANALLAVALMALLSSCLRFATERYWVSARLPIKVAATVVLLGGLAYLGWQTCRHTRENLWLARAAAAEHYSLAQAALLQNAFAVERMNADTALAIGEVWRLQSAQGGSDYRELAARALDWFARSRRLNPWDGTSDLRSGWCLDWLGQPEAASQCFSRAERLDPNGYFTMAYIGVHYVQVGDYAAAKPWFERSLDLEWHPQVNVTAAAYLELVKRTLLEGTTNQFSGALN
jgi:O-antigen ligase